MALGSGTPRSAVGRGAICMGLAMVLVFAISASPAMGSFGFQAGTFESLFLDGAGVPATQAGSHPSEVITSFSFNRTAGVKIPDGDVKDVEVVLPAM